MPVVTDINVRRSLVEIVAGGSTVARVRRAHYEKCPVEVGEALDVEAYLGRVAAIQFADGYEAALSCLDACDRSARELSNALRRRGYVAPAIEAVVARLAENGLIDDARYAKRMAQLSASKPVGVYAFRRRLRSKGISDEDAEDALEEFNDDQQRSAALEAARGLTRRYEGLPRREARAKLSQALARRGFGWDAIESAVEAVLEEP